MRIHRNRSREFDPCCLSLLPVPSRVASGSARDGSYDSTARVDSSQAAVIGIGNKNVPPTVNR